MATETTSATVATTDAGARPGIGTLTPADLIRALDAVIPHASTDAMLPMLCAVKIETEADGKRLTFAASDRYTLGTYSIDWNGGAVDELLPLADAKELLRFAKAADKVVRSLPGALTLDVSSGQVANVSDVTGRKATYLLGDREFVKWRAIMPSADYGDDQTARVGVFGLNPAYLARFAKAAGKGESIRLQLGASAVKPVRVTVGDFVGLIMPVRLPDASA